MDGWSSEEPERIAVGDRTMRVRRRVRRRRPVGLLVGLVVLLVLAGLGFGAYVYLNRPTGLAALPNPVVVAPGAFRASVGADKTITVGLEIRNTAPDVDVTVVAALIVAPSGLTTIEQALISPGAGNQGFALDGPLPAAASTVTLGIDATKRNGILAARFTVDCDGLPSAGSPTGEQIFVTVQLGLEQRVEELTSPVVNGIPWLTATARRACANPVATTPPESPLPALPGPTPTP